MSKLNLKRQKLFDREKVFRYYWIDLGSARSMYKLPKWMAANGMSNPATGNPFTPMGVWFAVWQWALENIELSRSIVNEGAVSEGIYYTEDEWMKFLAEKTKTAFRRVPRRRQRWLKANLSE